MKIFIKKYLKFFDIKNSIFLKYEKIIFVF